MEISSERWLSELEMDDSTFINSYQMNSFDQFTAQHIAAALGEDFKHSFSSESYSCNPPFNQKSSNTFTSSSIEASHTRIERPVKQLKTNNWNLDTTNPDSSSSHLLSFCNPNSPADHQQFYGTMVGGAVNVKDATISPRTPTVPAEILMSQGPFMNQNYDAKAGQGSKRVAMATKPPSQSQDHIIAERKRREKLTQRFIALTAIVPGLKKMDKASVLSDAIKYLKQLQERVKTLEDQTKKKTVESVVFVKKSQLSVDDCPSSSSEENSEIQFDEQLPEIEVRVSDRSILIRIHCQKQKGVLVKMLAEIEKLNLSIINTSVMPFANSALNITVVTQMDDEYCMTVNDLVRNLRSSFSRFM